MQRTRHSDATSPSSPVAQQLFGAEDSTETIGLSTQEAVATLLAMQLDEGPGTNSYLLFTVSIPLNIYDIDNVTPAVHHNISNRDTVPLHSDTCDAADSDVELQKQFFKMLWQAADLRTCPCCGERKQEYHISKYPKSIICDTAPHTKYSKTATTC